MTPDMCETCGSPRSADAKRFCSAECWHTWQRKNIKPSEATAARKRAYGRWFRMMDRCRNPANQKWHRYGGRGISVCGRWLNFDNYYADTGDAPDGMTLDRIDNDGNYEPTNVRWATPKQQRANIEYDPMGSKTSCKWGHPFDDANTYIDGRGWRTCRACARGKTARQRAARRAGV